MWPAGRKRNRGIVHCQATLTDDLKWELWLFEFYLQETVARVIQFQVFATQPALVHSSVIS